MLLSVCVLGYGETSKEFVSRFKNLTYYKKRDSDTEGVRVHVVYENDPSIMDRSFAYRYEMPNGNFANVLNDGDQETKREVTLSNDTEWLLQSNGHDTIFEAIDDADSYLDTVVALIRKGYWVILTNSDYCNKYREMLTSEANSSGSRLFYARDLDSIFLEIDSEYKRKLDHQRKTLLEESFSATQCGF